MSEQHEHHDHHHHHHHEHHDKHHHHHEHHDVKEDVSIDIGLVVGDAPTPVVSSHEHQHHHHHEHHDKHHHHHEHHDVKEDVSIDGLVVGPTPVPSPQVIVPSITPVYRYFRAPNTDHFYTSNQGEIGTTTAGEVGKDGYASEGIAFNLASAPTNGEIPVYRYFNAQVSDHFYTTKAEEIGTTSGQGNLGYSSEGVLGYIAATPLPGTIPVHRYYNASTSDHLYTTNANEIGATHQQGAVGQFGYVYEGVLGYAYQ